MVRTAALPRTSKVLGRLYFCHVEQKSTADAYGQAYLMAHPMGTLMTRRGTFHTYRPELPTGRTFGVAKRLEGYSPAEKLRALDAIDVMVFAQNVVRNKDTYEIRGARGRQHSRPKRSAARQEAGARAF